MTMQLDNYSDAMLADEIGALDRMAKDLAERLDTAKSEFKQRGLAEATGDIYAVRRTEATRWSLDTKKVRDAMGEAWATTHSRVSNVISLRIAAA